jgi:rhodanese-related sulfurtransferase
MSSRETKQALFEAIALMGKAFASPVRLELLDLLAQAPRSVEELARASGQSTANTSQHLQALRTAGMVTRARDYLGADVETIDRDALLERLARGEVVLVDVRPEEEYNAGHIDGARSIPLSELERRLTELPADTEVVAYCRGPFCAFAHEAVRRLRAEGRRARRLEDGWPEWRLAGGRAA